MDTLREANCKEELPEEKTAKEKLQETLHSLTQYQENLSFEDIIFLHMERNPKEFHAAELSRIIRRLDLELYCKIGHLMRAVDVSQEYATYLKLYLEGKIYNSEDVAKEALPLQISNAQEIIDVCRKEWDRG